MLVDTKKAFSNFEMAAKNGANQQVKRVPARDVPDRDPAEIRAETRRQIDSLIRKFGAINRLNMRYDENLDRVVVTVTNGETQEVIRRIPAVEFVPIMDRFNQFIGLTVERRV